MQGILLAAGHAACCWTRPVNASWATWATSTTLLELRRDAHFSERPQYFPPQSIGAHVQRLFSRCISRNAATAAGVMRLPPGGRLGVRLVVTVAIPLAAVDGQRMA
jgi:hypothetical protein